MSTGLMSCVRENSPPLEMDGRESGALSLPANGAEPQKRRRFHPLRNLRRIFRRRTLTSVDTSTLGTPSTSPASSPSSQISSAPTVIASVPAHNTSSPAYCNSKGCSPSNVTAMSSTTYPPHLIGLSSTVAASAATASAATASAATAGGTRPIGSCGVAIIPPFSSSVSASGGFYSKESRELSETARKSKEIPNELEDSREMTDCQRSFSEGRLVDSDFTRDGLSQSHDSVFSESATASSLSIVLKAELFDALRKRRNRPDASDEDLGLPRSPTTPQRKDQSAVNNQSEVSSLSLLSVASSDLDDELSSNYGLADKTSSSLSSSKMSSSLDASKTSDEIDFVVSSGSRLSHSAARHKMAVRPKKKGPTRFRRPAESTLLPSTPEVNEDLLKIPMENKDIMEKVKSHSLPPGVNAKILEQHSQDTPSKDVTSHIKRSKTEKVTSPTGAQSVRDISKFSSVDRDLLGSSSTGSSLDKKEEESGFFRRLLQRNSKKVKKSTDECDKIEDSISTTVSEQTKTSETETEFISSYKVVEETRKETRKEILSEAKSSLSAMLNTFILSPDHEQEPEPPVPKPHKPKSGPAARQRVIPKDLTSSPLPDGKSEKFVICSFIEHESGGHIQNKVEVENSAESTKPSTKISDEGNSPPTPTKRKVDLNKTAIPKLDDDMLGPKLVKSVTEESLRVTATQKESLTAEHFEKKERIQPKIVGLSPFLQKISRADTTLEITRPVPKQRKAVEKSKSFRYYSEGADSDVEIKLKKHENMPSLPDLTFSKKLLNEPLERPEKQDSPNKVEMAFEINDNNLIKIRRNEQPLPLSQGIYTKNIILTTTSKPAPIGVKPVTTTTSCNQNISEIEDNIDKLVKAPFVTVLKKSINSGDASVESKTVTKFSHTTTTLNRTESLELLQEEREVHEKKEVKEKIRSSSTSEIKKSSESVECKEKIKSEQQIKSTESISSSIETVIPKVEMRNKDISRSSTINKARRSSSVLEKFESNQVPEFMKITLNRVESTRPKSNIVLSRNVKPDPEEKETGRRYSNESVEITDNKPPLPPESSLKRNSIQNSLKSLDEASIRSPTKKVDEENNILKMTENTQSNAPALYERRKVFTEEKVKYEKKIEEKKKPAEEKKKPTEEHRRMSIDEETGVILRKKSFASINQSSNKEDTPELMKVFARRSLKIKDEELQSSFEEIEKSNTLKKFTNLDSDKENQSSSEEKLDKLPKVEITIQTKQVAHNGTLTQKTEDKTRNSLSEFRKPNTTNVACSTPTKTYVTPIRYSNIVGYRTVSTVYGKSTTQTTTSTTTIEQSSTSNLNEQNNNNSTSNNNNNKKMVGIRHTIAATTTPTAIIDQSEEGGEFKGILQRRAEWEKRAKEALK